MYIGVASCFKRYDNFSDKASGALFYFVCLPLLARLFLDSDIL